jgi:hypothetical protein
MRVISGWINKGKFLKEIIMKGLLIFMYFAPQFFIIFCQLLYLRLKIAILLRQNRKLLIRYNKLVSEQCNMLLLYNRRTALNDPLIEKVITPKSGAARASADHYFNCDLSDSHQPAQAPRPWLSPELTGYVPVCTLSLSVSEMKTK